MMSQIFPKISSFFVFLDGHGEEYSARQKTYDIFEHIFPTGHN